MKATMNSTSFRGFSGIGFAIAMALGCAEPGMAATFNVSSLADSGPGSLRDAVLSANLAVGPDQVVFEPGLSGTITLTSGEITITDPLVIDGPGATVLTVSGGNQSRVFVVNDGAAGVMDVTLSGLTLTQGNALGPGGAVLAVAEDLTIQDSVLTNSISNSLGPGTACGGNVALIPGAVPSSGAALRIVDSTLTGGVAPAGGGGNVCGAGVTLERCTVSGGSAQGGGGLQGSGVIRVSTVSGNTAAVGGGLYGVWTVESSTIHDNEATVQGGGIYVYFDGEVVNSTISGNSASLSGGGIYVYGHPDAPSLGIRLRLATLSNNTAASGGNLYLSDAAYALADHSILANGSPDDVAPQDFLEASYSLIETGATLPGSNNIIGVDPLLGPLADNGGPTLTHALLDGSPAIDAGDPAIPNPPATDQRGLTRIMGSRIDLGAVEVQQGIVGVPTLSEIGSLVLAALLVAIGLWRLRT